jgi:KaiC/GvpD/RAD55 family RecA-like ATPase
MPNTVLCPTCASLNKPDAANCRVCGRKIRSSDNPTPTGPPVVLQRVMGGEVFTAILGEVPKRPAATAQPPPAAQAPLPAVGATPSAAPDESEIEDHSDVIAAAVDRIRTKAQAQGHRFKPYVPGPSHKPPTPQAKQEAATYLQTAVGFLRESRFEEAIEPLLKGISRDDRDRRLWILLAEAYLRLNRPYKAAVGYLRALELSPKDDQGWLGLARVLRAIDDLPTAARVLERATLIHPRQVDTWVERGVILEALQNLSEAAKSFAKVLELRPDHRLATEKRQEIESKLIASRVSAESVPVAPPAAATTESVNPVETAAERDLLDEMENAFSLEATAPEATKAVAAGPPRHATPSPRVRTFVEGLDETLEGGIPRGHVVLIEGAPGTMKSSLGFSIIAQNAIHAGLHGLYLSLEERASSLLKQMGSLGVRLQVPKGSLVVLDPRTAKNLFADKADWLASLQEAIRSIKEQRGLDLIVIDSLEALEVLAKFKDRRREMYRLFEWLRDLAVTSFLVTERPDWVIAGHVLQGRWDEDFLADGVVQLRMHFVTDLTAQRRLRVVKMRGTKHETGYLAMDFDEGRFRVTRAMSS